MLPATNRLKIKQNTLYSWKNKRQITTPVFRIVYRFGAGSAGPKVGFIVTGKAGGATTRNRIRRVVIESVRGQLNQLPADLEAVFIVSKEIERPEYEKISNWVYKSLSTLHKPDS